MQYHNTLDAIAYYQTSAECEALYRQAFLLARLMLEAEMKRALAAGIPASKFYVISDCDETLLDNSAYNAWNLITGRDFFPGHWSKWCRQEQAEATPGSVEFLHFADMHSVPVYYVSSRFERDREATASNLRRLGFPLPNSSDDPTQTRLFLDGLKIDGKPTRKIDQFPYLEKLIGAPPLLTLGDNMSDHDPDRFSSKVRYDERLTRLQANADKIGSKWIVFPNPIYGGWRDTLRVKTKVGENEIDWPAKDEPSPVPSQEGPVRPSVTPAEAPKTGLLRPWTPEL